MVHTLPFAMLSVIAVVAAGAFPAAQALSRDEALRLVYPGATVRMEHVYLTARQQQLAAAQAGGEVPSALVARYLATRDGRLVGRAYIDTHVVRTKKETLLVSLDEAGRITRVDVTAFQEPGEYRAPDAWLRQYQGRTLEADLALHRVIRPMAGATLTARATNEAVRRVLAIDQVLLRTENTENRR